MAVAVMVVYLLMHCTRDCVSEGVKACSILSMPTRLWGWRVRVEASLNKAKSVSAMNEWANG